MKYVVKETGFIFKSRHFKKFNFAVMRHSTCEDRFVPMELFVEKADADKYLARKLKTGCLTGEMANNPENFRIFHVERVDNEKSTKEVLERIVKMMEGLKDCDADFLPSERAKFTEVAELLRCHIK